MKKTANIKSAFSLVELSIVLVILGLLVGGILAGKSLIRASEIRAVSSEFMRFQAAINTFRDKYFSLPGDFTNAYSFWGTALSCTNAYVSAAGTGCNGNGDNQIAAGTGEPFRMWQHLASAGLIEGSYSGTHTSNQAVPGTNVPTSKIGSQAGYEMLYLNPSVFLGWINTTSANYIHFGVQYTNDAPITQVLRPEEAWNIDTKFDDGMPGTGRFLGGRGYNGSWATCTSGSSYALTSDAIGCGMQLYMP